MHYRESVKNATSFDPSLISYSIIPSSLNLSELGKLSGLINKSFTGEREHETLFQNIELPFEFQFNPNSDYNTVRFLIKEDREYKMKKNIPQHVQIDRYNKTYKHTFKDIHYFDWDYQNTSSAYKLDYENGSADSFETLIITPSNQLDLKLRITNQPSLKI